MLYNLNGLEDEFHFVLQCTKYNDLRKKYIKKYYWSKPSTFKLVQLLSVENGKELRNLGKFIHLACKSRNNLVRSTCVVHNFLTYLCYFLICHIYMLYHHVIITCHIVYRGGSRISSQGRAHLKKIAPSGGRRENFWGISCEKSRFYAKKSYFFQFQGGGVGCDLPPPGSAPGILMNCV